VLQRGNFSFIFTFSNSAKSGDICGAFYRKYLLEHFAEQVVDLVKNSISKIKNVGKTTKKKKQSIAPIQK